MYLAHLRETGEEQSVKEHLENVAKLCEEFGGRIGTPKIAYLIGKLHDMGKTTELFTNYIRYSTSHPEDKSQKGRIDHSTAGAKYIYERFGNGDALDRLTAQIVALTVASHHGGLMDCIDLHGEFIFNNRMEKDEEKILFQEAIQAYGESCYPLQSLEDDFQKAKQEVADLVKKIKSVSLGSDSNYFAMGLLTKYLFSCLIDADRYDTYCFMAGKQEEKSIGIPKLWEELSFRLEKDLESKPKVTPIDLLRSQISEECKAGAHRGTGIYCLTVPTGGGKTLSSLRFALEHAKETGKERIFYIIPFTTIIDQNARDIKEILKRDDVVLEHHSNIIRDNEDEDYTLLTERWNSPIVFTTMVQFLNSLFVGGTQAVRRMHSLANSVIIFDEIQSAPLKCISLLNGALNFLNAVCHSTVVLCTATQPLLSQTKRPLMLNENPDIISDVQQKFNQFKRVTVKDKRIPGGYDENTLADFVFEQMSDLQSVLVILNTKRAARKLYRRVCETNQSLPEQEKCIIFHLSTSMCPAHRIQVLDELRGLLGHHRVICVSTKLIEAGVNISAECVIRALSGLDSIAQAAGRCNRHGEVRCRNAYIVNMKDENLSMLPDMQEGQNCTERILEEFKQDAHSLDHDLLSVRAMNQYYQYYFYSQENKGIMDYQLPKLSTNIYDLLSGNTEAQKAYFGKTGERPAAALKQAFQTAGEHFQVIDNNTTAVLVPYDNAGSQLVADINGSCSLEQLKNCLGRAQQYSVNLFSQDLRYLESKHAVYLLKNGGVLALNPQYYDKSLGVVTEETPLNFLLY